MAGQIQWQKIFWSESQENLPNKPTDEEINDSLADEDCPLSEVMVGKENEGNLRTLKRFAFTALKRFNHSARGCNFGIFASSGQGKTFVVKQWAKTLGIPFVFVQSASLKDNWQLFQEISEECKKFGTPVVPVKSSVSDYTLPPVIVFFDEVHQLPKNMMKGGLLNGMESDDGFMLAKPPGMNADSITIDCKDVCWIAATTEKGQLFDAFVNRLGTLIEWQNASLDQVAKIVFFKIEQKYKNGDLPFCIPEKYCKIVAKYCPVPREAISFAEKVVQQKDMHSDQNWESAVKQIANDTGLNSEGFTRKQMSILEAAGQRPIAEKNLPSVAQCRMEQVQRFELPRLVSYGNGGPFLVPISGKGMCVTKAALKLLDRFSIPHNGEKVTAEFFESRR